MNKSYPFTRKERLGYKTEQVGSLTFNSLTHQKAELRFYGDIVSNTWQSYYYEEDKCPQDVLEFLDELKNYESLDIYINSGGGSVHGGLAIYHLLKRYPGEKTVWVDGLAASIASVIAMAGDRLIVPATAQLMIHKPWSSVWVGTSEDYRREAQALDSCQEVITNVYMEHVLDGVSRETITDMINRETWMSGRKAAEFFKM